MSLARGNCLTIHNLSKSFQNHRVLAGINLEVKKGEIFCLLGSNGAGKTTLVSILTTLLSADGGTVFINGYNLQQEPKKIREIISLTGQYAAVDGFLTGRENLELIANLRHMKEPKAVAEAMLAQFNLTKAADKHTITYSGGMRRRLDIAMSLIGELQLIFLDEPTTGLDPQSRIAMWDTVKELRNQGTTIFLTTQYIEEAEQLADNIAILNKGIITVKGSVQELLAKYPDTTTLEQVFLKVIEEKEV